MANSNGLTSRKRSDNFVRRTPFRDAKLIVIATEGTVTEPHYFSIFSEPDSPFFNKKIKRLEILPTTNGQSSPRYVIDRIIEYRQTNDLNDKDQLWLVIDVDNWEKQGVLAPIVAEAHQAGIFLAISNPCFEVWLLCHFVEDLVTITDFKSIASQKLGNVKRKFDLTKYIDQIYHAILVAEASDIGTDPHVPNSLGTKIHKLMRSILPPRSAS